MPEDTINHAAEAMNFLRGTVLDTYGDHDRKVSIAQVHATLALVEEQRIANLIAAFQMEGGPYKESNNWTHDGEDANMRIRREVKEGLGL